MRVYPSLPVSILSGWASTNQTHSPRQNVDFHYHDVEEWLEVLRGEITFFTISGQQFRLTIGSVLQIPRGEVHRAEVGADGVEYQMLLPVTVPETFANRLGVDELAMLQTNLEFPIREDNKDGDAAQFFEEHLSEALLFCRANGRVVCKEAFRDGFADQTRSSSGTVQILNRTQSAVLVSTVVTMGAGGAAPKRFTNIRLFAKESGSWKCRMWINFPASAEAEA
jgi:Cupin domain